MSKPQPKTKDQRHAEHMERLDAIAAAVNRLADAVETGNKLAGSINETRAVLNRALGKGA